MKKSTLGLIIGAVVLLVILLVGGVLYMFYYLGFIQAVFPSLPPLGLKQTCGGIAGRPCPEGYVCEYEDGDIVDNVGTCAPASEDSGDVNLSEPVEYNESMGKVCPLGTRFLRKKDAKEIGCECPEGYEMDSDIIGGETGEQCYGPGTDCPIFAAECKPKKNNKL